MFNRSEERCSEHVCFQGTRDWLRSSWCQIHLNRRRNLWFVAVNRIAALGAVFGGDAPAWQRSVGGGGGVVFGSDDPNAGSAGKLLVDENDGAGRAGGVGDLGSGVGRGGGADWCSSGGDDDKGIGAGGDVEVAGIGAEENACN